MKILVIALMASFIGVATGFGISKYENSRTEYGFSKAWAGSQSDKEVATEVANSNARPSARVVGSDTHDFGAMSLSESRDHTFVIENIGDAPLTVAFDAKSCQCTKVELDKNVVPPGEQVNIYLQWKPTKFDLDFRQAALFRTNDPARREIELAIRGQVRQNGRATPTSVDFGPMSREQSQSISINVFGYRDEDFEVVDATLLDEENKDKFSVVMTPLTSDQLAAEVGALGGAVVKVDVAAGLPMGSFAQHVRITTNKNDIGPFDVAIRGQVIGDIRIVSSHYSRELNSFMLRELSGDKVHEFKFSLMVKGMQPEDIHIAAKSIDPSEVLSIKFDAPEPIGNVVRIPGTLVVTPTDKPVNRNGSKQAKSGKLILETSHPDVKEMEIRVAFSVEAS
jgi:hypothetical protein